MSKHLTALSIDHINMNVRDLHESAQFYADLFGFELKEDQPGQKSQIVGNDTIKLCMYEDPARVASAGISHFGFHVENFDDIVNMCETRGIPMPYGVIQWKHSRSVYIIDPNGYEIELSERPGGGL